MPRAAIGYNDKIAAVPATGCLISAPFQRTHPAAQLSPDELLKAGVSEDAVRLSVGIEHVDDLISDLAQALEAV